MRALCIAALAALAAGCATEVMVLGGPRLVDGETEPGAALIVTRRVTEHLACSYFHTSNPARGRPFNTKDSVSVDGAMCGWRWGGK